MQLIHTMNVKHSINLAKKCFSVVLLALFILPTLATAKPHQGFSLPSSIASKNLVPRGKASFNKFGFRIFKAKLWTDNDYQANAHKNLPPKPPYALQIQYARDIKAKYIVESTIKEMRKQNIPKKRLQQWKKTLKQTIPSVKKGDVITGVRTSQSTSFYLNNKFIGKVNGSQFGSDFFGIWLKPNTSEPKLRKQLMQLR